jgi:hypothetical protein
VAEEGLSRLALKSKEQLFNGKKVFSIKTSFKNMTFDIMSHKCCLLFFFSKDLKRLTKFICVLFLSFKASKNFSINN